METRFNHTPYDFPKLMEVSESLARQSVERYGGSIEIDELGREVFVIPATAVMPSPLERSWEPGPLAGSRFSKAELAQITTAPLREE